MSMRMATLAVVLGTALHVHAGPFTFNDDFADGTIDPPWVVEDFMLGNGGTYGEYGGRLHVTDLSLAAPADYWGGLAFVHTFDIPMTDFDFTMDFGWSRVADNWTDHVTAVLYDTEGGLIATGGATSGENYGIGGVYARQIGEISSGSYYGPDVGPTGSASLRIARSGDTVNMYWNDSLYLQGTDAGWLSEVQLQFYYRGDRSSAFGLGWVDSVQLTGAAVPEPSSLFLTTVLASTMGVGVIRRKRQRKQSTR